MCSTGGDAKVAFKRKFYEDREGLFGQPKIRKVDEEILSKMPTQRERDRWNMDMDEEAMLEKLVLGDLSSVLDKLGEDNDRYPRFSMDTEGDSGVEEGVSTPDEEEGPSTSRQPAWCDEEDSDLNIKDAIKLQNRKATFKFPGKSTDRFSEHLKQHFGNVMGTPKWAQLDNKDEADGSSDSDDEILHRCGKFVSKSHADLPRDSLQFKRVYDINASTYCEGPIITSMQFHPKSTVALVAGLSGVASLFQVDGEQNNKLHSIQFQKFPISCSRFSTDGDSFVVSSRKYPYFYRFDMVEGRTLKIRPHIIPSMTNIKLLQMSPDGQHMVVGGLFGHIHLLSAHSGESIATLKMNDEVHSFAFNADGSRLFSHGDSGEVYVWDIGSRSCILKFTDDGCMDGTALALSPNGQYVATGSSHGVVNIYESSSLTKSSKAPKPVKILYNLTTSVSSLGFNSTSEILAAMSNKKENACKLVHFPSMTVFKNFPANHRLSKPYAMDFSLHSGYFSLTNNHNMAFLYRLEHYGNY